MTLTVDDILPQEKGLAQLRLNATVGSAQTELFNDVRAAAVTDLENEAGVWLLGRSMEMTGVITCDGTQASSVKLQDYITPNGITAASVQNRDGTRTAIALDQFYMFTRVEYGRRVIRLQPADTWPAPENVGTAVMFFTIEVGATAEQVSYVLDILGWRRFMMLRLQGHWDHRFASPGRGQPYDHAAAKRIASGLQRPMAMGV